MTLQPDQAMRACLILTAYDVRELAHLLPPSALELVRAIGPDAAVALIGGLPGVQLVVPKYAAANPAGARRWAQLAQLVGADVMPHLVAVYGGGQLDVPTCAALLLEKRNRWLRRRFDDLTAPAGPTLSRRSAVYELGIELALASHVLTYRQIERVIDAPDGGAPAPTPQLPLFHTPP